MSKSRGYGFAAILAIVSVLVCWLIADGLIGIEGTIGNLVEEPSGYREYTLHVHNPTGRIVFWIGLIVLSVGFAPLTSPRYTWISLPIFSAGWWILYAIFGEWASHAFLAHPSSGFLSIGDEWQWLSAVLVLYILQTVILSSARLIWMGIRKRTGGKPA